MFSAYCKSGSHAGVDALSWPSICRTHRIGRDREDSAHWKLVVILAHSDHDSRRLNVRAGQGMGNDVCHRFTHELSRFGIIGPRMANFDKRNATRGRNRTGSHSMRGALAREEFKRQCAQAIVLEHEDYCDNGNLKTDCVALVQTTSRISAACIYSQSTKRNGMARSDAYSYGRAPLLRLHQRTALSSIQRAGTIWQLGGSK